MDVLIAHREAVLRDRLRGLFERAGLVVGDIGGPDEVVEICREHDPDVVFLQAAGGMEALDGIKSDADEFLEEVDRALVRARNAGRDRVCGPLVVAPSR